MRHYPREGPSWLLICDLFVKELRRQEEVAEEEEVLLAESVTWVSIKTVIVGARPGGENAAIINSYDN